MFMGRPVSCARKRIRNGLIYHYILIIIYPLRSAFYFNSCSCFVLQHPSGSGGYNWSQIIGHRNQPWNLYDLSLSPIWSDITAAVCFRRCNTPGECHFNYRCYYFPPAVPREHLFQLRHFRNQSFIYRNAWHLSTLLSLVNSLFGYCSFLPAVLFHLFLRLPKWWKTFRTNECLIAWLTYTDFFLTFPTPHSTRPLEVIHSALRNLSIDYILLERAYCYGWLGQCTMRQIWNVEDSRTNYWATLPAAKFVNSGIPTCHRLFQFNPEDVTITRYFDLVFNNDLYTLFRLKGD